MRSEAFRWFQAGRPLLPIYDDRRFPLGVAIRHRYKPADRVFS